MLKPLLVWLLLLCLIPLCAAGEPLLRLHVVANSDTAADQALKLRVRDEVLATVAHRGSGDYFQDLNALWPDICDAARRAGHQEEMRLETCIDQGQPVARILLAKGAGRNWWGLLNPQLTLAAAGEGPAVWQLRQVLAHWLWACN